jgi:hypothetical protein
MGSDIRTWVTKVAGCENVHLSLIQSLLQRED